MMHVASVYGRRFKVRKDGKIMSVVVQSWKVTQVRSGQSMSFWFPPRREVMQSEIDVL